MDKKLTVEEMMELLKVSRLTIFRWRKMGMPWISGGGGVRFDAVEVEEWLRRNRKEKK